MITLEFFIENNETKKRLARQSVLSIKDIKNKRELIKTLKMFFHNVNEAIDKMTDHEYEKSLF